jgi:glutamate synthase (NADPH/NADH) large chain
VDAVLDKKLIRMCEEGLEKNRHGEDLFRDPQYRQGVGAMLSGEVCRRCGEGVLLEDTITCKFKGISGQSFGAFLAKGITFELEGMCNDYVGKSISGGKIIVYPDARAQYQADKNIIFGNTTFYGAIAVRPISTASREKGSVSGTPGSMRSWRALATTAVNT